MGLYSSSDPESFLFFPRTLPVTIATGDTDRLPTNGERFLSCRQEVVPLRAAAGFLAPVSESESQMDLSGFFALGAAGFLGLGAASGPFLAAAEHRERKVSVVLRRHGAPCWRSPTVPFFAGEILSNAELLE